jgi:hypothetical protein
MEDIKNIDFTDYHIVEDTYVEIIVTLNQVQEYEFRSEARGTEFERLRTFKAQKYIGLDRYIENFETLPSLLKSMYEKIVSYEIALAKKEAQGKSIRFEIDSYLKGDPEKSFME